MNSIDEDLQLVLPRLDAGGLLEFELSRYAYTCTIVLVIATLRWSLSEDAEKQCSLCSNNLQALPEAFASLGQLRVLRLNYNKFQAIPTVLAQLTRLETLELSGNNLSTVTADDFTALTSLR